MITTVHTVYGSSMYTFIPFASSNERAGSHFHIFEKLKTAESIYIDKRWQFPLQSFVVAATLPSHGNNSAISIEQWNVTFRHHLLLMRQLRTILNTAKRSFPQNIILPSQPELPRASPPPSMTNPIRSSLLCHPGMTSPSFPLIFKHPLKYPEKNPKYLW